MWWSPYTLFYERERQRNIRNRQDYIVARTFVVIVFSTAGHDDKDNHYNIMTITCTPTPSAGGELPYPLHHGDILFRLAFDPPTEVEGTQKLKPWMSDQQFPVASLPTTIDNPSAVGRSGPMKEQLTPTPL